MENKIMKEINGALKSLDNVADSFGAARSTHIAILGNRLLEISRDVKGMMTELEELRRFKEEHTDHPEKPEDRRKKEAV